MGTGAVHCALAIGFTNECNLAHAEASREQAVTMVRIKFNREDACSMVQDEPLTLFLGEPLR